MKTDKKHAAATTPRTALLWKGNIEGSEGNGGHYGIVFVVGN